MSFPAAPTVGQTHTDANGQEYIWIAKGAWKKNVAAAGGGATDTTACNATPATAAEIAALTGTERISVCIGGVEKSIAWEDMPSAGGALNPHSPGQNPADWFFFESFTNGGTTTFPAGPTPNGYWKIEAFDTNSGGFGLGGGAYMLPYDQAVRGITIGTAPVGGEVTTISGPGIGESRISAIWIAT